MEQPYWQRTQLMLQGGDRPLVRRPKLTPALLQKPPFRFLHDVISEVGAAPAVLLYMQLGRAIDSLILIICRVLSMIVM